MFAQRERVLAQCGKPDSSTHARTWMARFPLDGLDGACRANAIGGLLRCGLA